LSDIAREVLGRFPIENLGFVFVAGFFTVVSFPFDLFSRDFSRSTYLSIVSEQSVSCSLNWLGLKFDPFVNIKYLGYQFPTGLAELVLVSLPVGLLLYVLFELYGWINRRPYALYLRFIRRDRSSSEEIGKPFDSPISSDSPIKKWVCGKRLSFDSHEQELDFYDWLKETGIVKSIDFLVLMRSSFEGILYGSETFFFIVFFCLVFSWLFSFTGTLEWFVGAIVIFPFSYVIYLASEKVSQIYEQTA